MNDDLILNLSRAVDAVRDGIDDPVWVPLEAILPQDEVPGFMWMGAAEARIYDPLGPRDADCNPIITERRTIFLYKHGITRSYLNIGDDLNCYWYKPTMCKVGDPVYQRVNTERAIGRVFFEIEKFGATRSTAYDAEYIAERNRHLVAAGYKVVG